MPDPGVAPHLALTPYLPFTRRAIAVRERSGWGANTPSRGVVPGKPSKSRGVRGTLLAARRVLPGLPYPSTLWLAWPQMRPRSRLPPIRPRPLLSALALTVAVALGACASMPVRSASQPEVELPAQWSQGGAADHATALAQWWQRFDDPHAHHPGHPRAARPTPPCAVRRPRCARRGRCATFRPPVSGRTSAPRPRRSAASRATRQRPTSSRPASTRAGSRTSSAASAAPSSASEADAQASAASLADAQVSVAAEVAVDYVQLRGFQARLAIARSNLTSQQETVQITDWREQAGLVTSLELGAGAHRGRADAGPDPGPGDQRRAGPPRPGGADRAGAGRHAGRSSRSRRRCRRPRTTSC